MFAPKAALTAIAVAIAIAAPSALAQPVGSDQEPGQRFEVLAGTLPLPGGALPYESNAPVAVSRGDRMPIVPDGFTVTLFMEGLPHPRRIEVLPDGTVLIVQQRTGQLIQLGDESGDGVADSGGILASGFDNPFGIALLTSGPYAGDLLLSDVNTIWRLPLATGGEVARVTPAGSFGDPQGHITRPFVVDPASADILVSVGSIQNLGQEPEVKATIQRFAADGTGQAVFARGLRNATGLRLQPGTGDLYAVVMERDGMGDALVPDFFTRIEQGDDFGWPYQYAGGFVQPEYAADGVKRAAAALPDVLFEAHSAPMDLIFLPDTWPEAYRGGAIVALKGSSNRRVPTGYKLVFVPFGPDGRPTGGYQNFATGFWVGGASRAEVWGRPAALGLMPDGGLLVADDLAGTVWKIMPPAVR